MDIQGKRKSPLKKKLLFFLLDAVLINISSFSAIYLRIMETLPSEVNSGYITIVEQCAIPCTVLAIFIFWLFKIYDVAWKYAGERELLDLAVASACSAAFYILYTTMLNLHLPRSFSLLYGIILFVLMCASRLLYRKYLQNNEHNKSVCRQKKRTMIIGAGTAGAMAIKEFSENLQSENLVVCIIDDDVNKLDSRVRGVKVVGGRECIASAVKDYNISEIVFCIPSASHQAKKDILEICAQTGKEIKSLPTLSQLANGEVKIDNVVRVDIDDLLGRPQVCAENANVAFRVTGKAVLVTGGGGSIGSELCRQLAALNPSTLIIFDIYENNAYDIQMELKRLYPKLNLVVLIGSVRDEARVRYVFDTYRPTAVCHAAAHKHVPLMEDSPAEAIKNNIFGTYNVAKAAADYGTELFTLVSTDKAVNPTNVMGASKRFCEMIIQSMNGLSDTKFIAVRFGNVLGSNGSVIPLFRKQIAEGGPVTVTDKRVTRFFMTIPEAVSLILQAGAFAEGGEVFVLDMGSPVKIDDMARKMIRLSGFEPDVDIKVEYTGLRPGEKLFEELLLKSEGLKKTANDLIFIGHQRIYTSEEIEDKLSVLRSVLYLPGGDVRECMLNIIQEPVDTSYERIPEQSHEAEKSPAE